MVEWAVAYAQTGWAVFPVRRDKKPYTEHGHLDATCDLEQIRAWWERWPEANIGLPVPAGYVVLDVDVKDGAHISDLGELPETVIARSGGGGWHVWFRLPENSPEIKGGKALPGVDIRAGGKNYLLVFPSIHPSGQQYEWETEPITMGQVAVIPDHLLELVRKEAPLPPKDGPSVPGDAQKWLDEALAKAEVGNRNPVGFDMACQLRDDGISYEDAERVMLEYQRRVDHPRQRYTEQEAVNSLTSAYAAPAREKARSRNADPRTERLAEEGVAQASPSLSSSDQVRASVGTVAPSGGNDAPEAISEDGEGIHSFHSIPFIQAKQNSSGLSEWDKRYPDLLAAMQEVDALPIDGVVQHPGSPANQRRRKQYNILRTAWEIAFPADPLTLNAMSKWLNLVEPGMEGELVLDQLDGFLRAPHNGPIRTPRAAFTTALLNDLDPEGKAERRAKKDAGRIEYRKSQKSKDAKANKDEPKQPKSKPQPDPGEWRDPEASNVLARLRRNAEARPNLPELRELADDYARRYGLA
jgi:hypothetical protein